MQNTINKMNTLSDMARFPWTVHLGASLNIVFTMWLTFIVFGKVAGDISYLLPFSISLIALNILPVIFLRKRDTNINTFPTLPQMDFFKDQHRFSTWVYAIASGNMFFWITVTWWVLSIQANEQSLVIAQVFAFCITFVPLWRRFFISTS